MPEQFTATAVLATDAPERYAKQLASHLGRRVEVRHEGAAGTTRSPSTCVCMIGRRRIRRAGLSL